MPTEHERKVQQTIYREYRKRGYGKKKAAYIARAVAYGPKRRRKRPRRPRASFFD